MVNDDKTGQPGTPSAGANNPQGTSPNPGENKGTPSPTPGQDPGKGDDEPKVYSQAQLEVLLQREAGKLTRKYSKEIEGKDAELAKLRETKLTEPEKMQARIAELEQAGIEKDIQLQELILKTKRREMLEARIAGKKMAIPEGKTVADLLRLVSGNEDEDIAASLDFIETLFPVVPVKNIGAGTKPGSPSEPPKFTREQIKKMSPEEYEKNREDIMKALESGQIT